MEIVNPTNMNAASMLLLEAMVKKAKTADICQSFGIAPQSGANVEVQLTVNGVEVEFVSAVNEMWERLTANYEAHILEKAKELVSVSRFDKLCNLLQDAEWQIEEELMKLQVKG